MSGSGAVRYRAVTFDFWNTLVAETDEPVKTRRLLWAEILAEAGREVTEQQLNDAFKYAWDHFDKRWQANQQSSAVQMAADGIAHLDLGLSSSVEAALTEAYLDASLLTPRVLVDGAEETLDRLRGLGLSIGIVSDVGAVPSSQIAAWLDELGVHHLVNHFSFSDHVGVFKPDPEIFRHALQGLGVSDPGEAAHVGDIRRTDVAGANDVGMTSVQFTGARQDPANDDPKSARPDHVIDDHLDLLEVLRLH